MFFYLCIFFCLSLNHFLLLLFLLFVHLFLLFYSFPLLFSFVYSLKSAEEDWHIPFESFRQIKLMSFKFSKNPTQLLYIISFESIDFHPLLPPFVWTVMPRIPGFPVVQFQMHELWRVRGLKPFRLSLPCSTVTLSHEHMTCGQWTFT